MATRLAGRSWGGRARQIGLIALALGVAGLITRQPLLALLGVFVALLAGLTALWQRLGLREVSYRRSFSQDRAFPDEEIVLELLVENAKLLPLPWLEVEDEFPNALQYPGLTLALAPKPKVSLFRSLFSLKPFERVRRRYRVSCTARGAYVFGPVRLTTGDPFGFVSNSSELEQFDTLLVYPRLVPVTDFGIPANQPFGDDKPVRPLMEDPLRFSGVRPYAPGDLPRRIHWRASARTGELQSKQFEPGALATLAIFLDVNTFERFWEGLDPERLERAISAAASLAAHGLEARRQVGIYANAPVPGRQRLLRIPPGRAPGQLARILEALALVVPYTGNRVEAMIANETRRLPWGSTIVVVTGYVTEGLESALARLHRAGHAITLVSFSEQPTRLRSRPGFTVYQLGEEVAGGEPLAQLTLA